MHGLPPTVEQLIDLALIEDLGNGDITTRLTAPSAPVTSGRVVAKAPLVVSGGDVFERVMYKVNPAIALTRLIADGSEAAPDDAVISLRGDAASVLMGERVALNFIQRLSGVATMTKAFVNRLPKDGSTVITDTRKTTPGMRFLERRAVVHGGGRNHRPDLGGGILIKENHIRAAGSVTAAVSRCREGAPHPLKVEVEVTNEAELREALEAGAEGVLLDNMTPDAVARCVAIVDKQAIVEVSGGVTLETVATLAQTGVDIISVGALTHSAPASDLSLLFDMST